MNEPTIRKWGAIKVDGELVALLLILKLAQLSNFLLVGLAALAAICALIGLFEMLTATPSVHVATKWDQLGGTAKAAILAGAFSLLLATAAYRMVMMRQL